MVSIDSVECLFCSWSFRFVSFRFASFRFLSCRLRSARVGLAGLGKVHPLLEQEQEYTRSCACAASALSCNNRVGTSFDTSLSACFILDVVRVWHQQKVLAFVLPPLSAAALCTICSSGVTPNKSLPNGFVAMVVLG